MRQHRSIDHDRHGRIMPPTRYDAPPAIAHPLVSGHVLASPSGWGTGAGGRTADGEALRDRARDIADGAPTWSLQLGT
jgi:hypothetical protein